MKSLTGLHAFQAISNGALSGTELPKRIKLFNWGENKTLKGTVKVGPNTLKALTANQAAFGFQRIALDYEHQSVPGHKNFKAAPREYAAYGAPEVIEGEGLFVDAITYTPSGIKNGPNHEDLSPVVHLDQSGEVDFLHSVALCPQGAVEGLTFFTAPEVTLETLTAMNPDLKTLLTTLFALDPSSSEEDILAAGKTFAEKITAASKTTPDLTAMSADLAGMKKRLDDNERDTILAAALREGKLVPNSARELPLETFKTLVAELPADMVPLDKRTPANVTALSATISATDLAVARQLGLKPEDMAAK